MQATRSTSAAIPTSIESPPQDNSCLNVRTTKIALAIFASLAGFIFLPMSMAITLSVVVTLGALVCSSENVPTSPQVEESIPVRRLNPPTIEFSSDCNVILRFRDSESLAKFNEILFSQGRNCFSEYLNCFSEYLWSWDLNQNGDDIYEVQFSSNSDKKIDTNYFLKCLEDIYGSGLVQIAS